jgi:AsmA protein
VKKALLVSATLLALLLAAILVVPAFVDLGRFKSTYLPLVEEALQRRIDVGEVRLTLVPTPSIKLSNLKVSGTPAFPAANFFAAEEVQLRLKLWPLFRGRFEITEFVLDKPIFTLQKQTSSSSGHDDFAGKKAPSLSRRDTSKAAATKQQDSAAAGLIIPDRLRVKDGQLNIVTAGRTPVRIHGIGLSMEEFSSEKPFPYRATFDYPGLKTVTLTGQLDYEEEQAKLILKDNHLTVQNLTLPLEGNISNLATAPRFDLVLADENVDARPVMQILGVFGLAPRDTELSGPMALRVALTGPSNNMLTQVRGQFQNVKLSGKRAIKGSLNGAVLLHLPIGGGSEIVQQVHGNGKLSAREGELTNVDLIKKIQRATSLIGFSQHQRREATTFKTLETEFTLGNGVVDFKRIYLVNPQLEINGAGTMTLGRQALNIGMDATLSPLASTKAGRGSSSEFLKDRRGQLVVPLTVTGHAENPAVNIDSKKLTRRGASQSMEKGLATLFRQLFQR